MSADSEGREDARDLELTTEEADRVKGGVLPIDGGAGGTSYIAGRKKRKKRKKQNTIGPYKGKH